MKRKTGKRKTGSAKKRVVKTNGRAGTATVGVSVSAPANSANPINPNVAKIKVLGVGGGGCNAVDRMVAAKVTGVDFLAVNTDLQVLNQSKAPIKIQLGSKLTKGLGSGANPEIGRQAALEDTEALVDALEGADMVFITAGLGGGTGTGAAPIIANLASELGALTVGIVTKPFAFEGRRRMLQADQGLAELTPCVDTLICVPNESLLQAVEPGTSFFEAFRVADDILRQAVQGITDIITIPGVINRDFADVRAVMKGMGYAVMGTAVARGKDRAIEAVQNAMASPLLEEGSIEGARGVLLNITGSSNLGLQEVQEASGLVHKAAHQDANILFGAVLDESLKDAVKITVIATGFRTRAERAEAPTNRDRRVVSQKIAPELKIPLGLGLANPPVNPDDLDIPAYLRHRQ